ncbi:MAG: 4Fe-4S dicluster domain-containing protein [Sutterella sp.]|nr:4Fe-4S dicluster domain-containing protein [Sutterella sp.]
MRKGIVVNVDLCVGCQACFVACKQENRVAPRVQWLQIQRHENQDKAVIEYFRMGCMHCEAPACLPVCPVKAIYQGPAGEVLVDSKHCIACGQCEKACPWHVPVFNRTGKTSYWDKPALVEIAPLAHQVREVGRAEHCTLCAHREVPACVIACQLGALTLVDYEHPDVTQQDLIARSVEMNGAEETKPKVRYICNTDDVKVWARRMQHLV